MEGVVNRDGCLVLMLKGLERLLRGQTFTVSLSLLEKESTENNEGASSRESKAWASTHHSLFLFMYLLKLGLESHYTHIYRSEAIKKLYLQGTHTHTHTEQWSYLHLEGKGCELLYSCLLVHVTVTVPYAHTPHFPKHLTCSSIYSLTTTLHLHTHK